MAKVSLASHMREQRLTGQPEGDPIGPFVTISRQYGCYGFSLGLLLQEVLNEDVGAGPPWKVYHKDILERLATQTNLAAELLEQQRRNKPRLIVDFFRALSQERIPSGSEIRNRITTIIRGLAIQGRVILIGQGATGATHDLPNGLSVRLEAPEDWRIRQICLRYEATEARAKADIEAKEREAEYLRRIYEQESPVKPAFHIVYDCSTFTLAQIAQHIACAMRLRRMI